MTDDIDTLSGPELSAAVAREVFRCDELVGTEWWKYAGNGTFVLKDWKPHVSHDDAVLLLRHCHWRKILLDYGFENIDPAIICRAALRAVRASR